MTKPKNVNSFLEQAYAASQSPISQENVRQETLGKLEAAVKEMIQLHAQIEETKSHLTELNRQYETLRLTDIPSLMQSSGLVTANGKGKFCTSTGVNVYLRHETFVSVYAEDREAAIAWLRAQNHEHALKTEFSTRALKEILNQKIASGIDPDTIKNPSGERPLFKRHPVVMAVAVGRKIDTSS